MNRAIGLPWRHLAAGDSGLDGLGPGAGFVVAEKRKRPDLAGAMAEFAVSWGTDNDLQWAYALPGQLAKLSGKA